MAFAAGAARPCTLAIISAKTSANGRAMMWKNRDTTDPNNKLMFFKGPEFDFAAMVISEDLKGDGVWGGQNTAGFAIMNSRADDLRDASKKFDGGGNGRHHQPQLQRFSHRLRGRALARSG